MKKFLKNNLHLVVAIGLAGLVAGGAFLMARPVIALISPNPIDGVCGTANGYIFPASQTGYSPQTQCSVGASSNTAYPAPGGTVAWQCKGTGGGINDSCSASRAVATCNLPWGGTIADGASVTAYQTALVAQPTTCSSETRSCSNGVLSGSYTNQACTATTATFTALPASIAYGGKATLTWASSNATSCTAGGPWSNLTPPTGNSLNGSGLSNPITSATTFTFYCTGAAGNTNTISQTVTPSAPPTVSISADKTAVVSGSTATLTWNPSNVTSCTASGTWSGSLATVPNSTQTVTPPLGTNTYTITCANAAGTTATDSVIISSVVPPVGGNLHGYAWSYGTGWLSFNSDTGSSPTSYGVSVNTSTGALSGYAWSSNVGWISFNAADTASCPTAPCAATINLVNGKATGWARALATGGGTPWSGWIHLSDASWAPGVSMDLSTGDFSGYAWGTTYLGYINFGKIAGTGNGVTGPVLVCGNGAINPPTCNQFVPTVNLTSSVPPAPTVPLNSTAKLTWTSTNTTSCTASGSWSGTLALNGGPQTVGPLSAGAHTYTLTCSGPGGSASDSATINVASFAVGDGVCSPGETPLNSPSDCKSTVKQF